MRIGVAATAPLGADVLERLAEQHEIAWLLTRPAVTSVILAGVGGTAITGGDGALARAAIAVSSCGSWPLR